MRPPSDANAPELLRTTEVETVEIATRSRPEAYSGNPPSTASPRACVAASAPKPLPAVHTTAKADATRKATSTNSHLLRRASTALGRSSPSGGPARPTPKATNSTATISVSDLSMPSPEYSSRATATAPDVAAAAPTTKEGTQTRRALKDSPSYPDSGRSGPSHGMAAPLISPRGRDSFSACSKAFIGSRCSGL